MKNMKKVFVCLGMGSCVSTKTVEPPSNLTLEKALDSAQSPVWELPGSKEEAFFDSKPWLESDDEQDFYSVNGDIPPYRQSDKNGDDHEGRRLSELFKESSFNSESQTSAKARSEAKGKDDEEIPTFANTPSKIENGKSGRSVNRCLPSLVRSLSCGDRKKRPNPAHIAVVG
ncbi:uncharacterized protein At3g27210 isoform X2 [Spinacia oleracea]|uniref:Uncharacterized protein At3g27210 isoform X2 n=1 Tax=Spinacia oleracea TaxID=3562 RepID=A0A9R0ISV4_SPIOL|nr:uncharacterized protein At3g27210-like isoform X2 [Spinacia oleracea]